MPRNFLKGLLVAVGIILLPHFAFAASPLITDDGTNFNSNFIKTTSNRDGGTVTSSGCRSGSSCFVGGTGGAWRATYQVPVPGATSGFDQVFWVKATNNVFFDTCYLVAQANAQGGAVCSQTSGGGESYAGTVTNTLSITNDGNYHSVLVSTKLDTDNTWLVCTLVDDLDTGDCSYSDTNIDNTHAANWDGFGFGQESGTAYIDDFEGTSPPPVGGEPNTPPNHQFSVSENGSRFTLLVPDGGTVATTSDIGFTAYVAPADFATGTVAHVSLYQPEVAALSANLIDACNVFGNGQCSIDFPITAAGTTTGTVSVTYNHNGTVRASWSLTSPTFWSSLPLIGGAFSPNTIADAKTNYVVGFQSQADFGLNGDGTATTTQPVRIDCLVAGGCTATTSTASLSVLSGLGSVFNMSNVVFNKFPINWVVEFASILNSLASSTATTTITNVDVDFGSMKTLQSIPTTTVQSLNISFFSSATLDEVAAIPAIGVMRTVISWGLWLELMWYAWRRAMGIFQKTQN